MNQSWQVFYVTSVLKNDLPSIDRASQKRISQIIENKLMVNPSYFGKPLRYQKSGQYSLRVGDYRIVYTIDVKDHRVTILAIGHRRDIYEE